VRVSDILVADEFVFDAARAETTPRADAFVAARAVVRPGITAVRVRVVVSVRGVVIDKVPARDATIFWARVCVAARVESDPVRGAVVVRDCVVDALRPDVGDDAPSRTAVYAGAPAKKPRIAPKIRIFFISGINVSKICKFVAREK